MPGKILVVGSLNMDLVVSTPLLPLPGETILGGMFATFPGGKGANQAVAAARMGASVTMIGRVGSDAFGQELLDVAAADGIDTSFIGIDEQTPSGIALITVDAEGRNTIVVAGGANRALAPEHLHAATLAFSEADVLIIQLEIAMETVKEAFALATRNKLKVILNPAPACPLDAELLSRVDYFIPNEREAMQVAGAESLEGAIQKLTGLGIHNLIITLGEKGVLAVTDAGRMEIPAHRVKTVDTVAAGDAFVGAFATGIAEGSFLETAIRLGNAAAAISVTRHGAQPSLPKRAEVEKFLKR